MSLGERLTFRQVDVFTAVPFRGNPVAVVLDNSSSTTAVVGGRAVFDRLRDATRQLITASTAAPSHKVAFIVPPECS